MHKGKGDGNRGRKISPAGGESVTVIRGDLLHPLTPPLAPRACHSNSGLDKQPATPQSPEPTGQHATQPLPPADAHEPAKEKHRPRKPTPITGPAPVPTPAGPGARRHGDPTWSSWAGDALPTDETTRGPHRSSRAQEGSTRQPSSVARENREQGTMHVVGDEGRTRGRRSGN
ncbi:hypothetical protein GCM10010510_68660 [Streptomyces anandii JCM 4720]|nr:hypothetical protein GCM10010510_68660 [Streptomyces anandii JCM 4720]